jgi:protein QN1
MMDYYFLQEMKHFISLQDKIRDMETRHGQRERELQTIIQHSRTMAHADMADEINKWRRQVDTKNHELERFRVELDSILDVLKELQRQGVVLPYKGSGSGYSSQR